MTIYVNKRNSVQAQLKEFCPWAKPDSTIEACMWANGEGWDIFIDDNRHFSFTCGEVEAITALVNYERA